MRIVRKSEREQFVEENPLEIHYKSYFSEPFTTLEIKFKGNPKFEIGDYLYLINGKETVWSGRVMQKAFEMNKSEGGEYSILARSDGFVLFQTEARPAVYEKPAFGDIAAFHLVPHNIKFSESAVRCPGEFAVKSGATEWEVIENFCLAVAGKRPFADGSGMIYSGEKLSDNVILFSDNILSVKLQKNGETAVRTVHYKPDRIGDYKFFVTNGSQNAVCGSEKYENLSNLPHWQGESRLNQILKSSLRRTEVLTVKTDEFPAGCHVGDKARVLNFTGAYRIESIDYRKNGRKTECVFTLLPENFW